MQRTKTQTHQQEHESSLLYSEDHSAGPGETIFFRCFQLIKSQTYNKHAPKPKTTGGINWCSLAVSPIWANGSFRAPTTVTRAVEQHIIDSGYLLHVPNVLFRTLSFIQKLTTLNRRLAFSVSALKCPTAEGMLSVLHQGCRFLCTKGV